MKKFKLGLYIILSTLSIGAMASINNPTPEKINSENLVTYKLHEDGININGSLKSTFLDGSPVYLYVFKDNTKSYDKYSTYLQKNKFEFENLVYQRSYNYNLHYNGTYHYKIVVGNNADFSKTYKITNNEYKRVKIDHSKGLTYPTPDNKKAIAKKQSAPKIKKREPGTQDNSLKTNLVEQNIKNNDTKTNTETVKITNKTPPKQASQSTGSAELDGFITRMEIAFNKYEQEYLIKEDKYAVSSQFKAELSRIFKSNHRVPSNLCVDAKRSFRKSIHKLTIKLKNNEIKDASSVLKDIRRFTVCK